MLVGNTGWVRRDSPKQTRREKFLSCHLIYSDTLRKRRKEVLTRNFFLLDKFKFQEAARISLKHRHFLPPAATIQTFG